VRNASVWARLLGVERTVVEGVEFDEDEEVLIAMSGRSGASGAGAVSAARRCGGYDGGEGRRRWRALDLGTVRAELEACAPGVSCPEHGVVVAAVPWARHGAGHTRYFDDTVAWAGGGVVADGGVPADADRLEHRRGDRHTSLGGRGRGHRPIRRAAPDRDR
jgi:transposase